MTRVCQPRTLRAEVFDREPTGLGQIKWEVGAPPESLRASKANTAPATVNASLLHKSDTSLKTLIHDVAEGNIGGNSVFYAVRRLQTYGSTSPPSSLAVAFLD